MWSAQDFSSSSPSKNRRPFHFHLPSFLYTFHSPSFISFFAVWEKGVMGERCVREEGISIPSFLADEGNKWGALSLAFTIAQKNLQRNVLKDIYFTALSKCSSRIILSSNIWRILHIVLFYLRNASLRNVRVVVLVFRGGQFAFFLLHSYSVYLL